LDRLDDTSRLLARGSAIAPTRQQTLAGTFDWSHELCLPRERELWARLSVFVGGSDQEAVEEVCSGSGIDRSEVLDLVAGLVDNSIVYS
jgi:predicted ATPase